MILRLLAALAATCAVAAGGATAAHAAAGYEVGIADDRLLLSDPAGAPELAATWAAMGVDTVRIHARWVAIAPGGSSRSRPEGFDARDPLSHGYRWGFLDAAVDAVRAAGMRPVLAVTGSGPLWGVRHPAGRNPRSRPDPRDFADFTTAVARHFSGRVDRYLIWNEPNIPGWLQPQFSCRKRRCTPESPHIYRSLVRAAYPAIKRVDPRAEVIAGTLAPRGSTPDSRNDVMRPLTFLRAFGCVDDRWRRTRRGRCANFRPATVDGFAYHPHGVLRAPDERNPNRDEAALADLGRLTTALDRIQSQRGFKVAGARRAPLHLTEFGYQTDPPDPFSGVSPARQARYLQQAARIVHANPRVRSLVQYEWQDEPVDAKAGRGARAFAGWQSGLIDARGRRKRAHRVFPVPLWVELPRGSSKARIWGQVRPGTSHTVSLQRRRPGGGWRTVARLRTDRFGSFTTRRRTTTRERWRFRATIAGDDYRGPITLTSASMTPYRPRR